MIQFDGVSKRYQKRSRTLHEALRRFFGGSEPGPIPGSLTASEFWALRNVSFQVERGETLGIIGQNGAGKSTILKLIAGITAPSIGHVTVTGRVGCLIELGAGFNPELTGTENIFLNGILLGLSRKEISKTFDQIVAFSGMQDFLDMPVKYYSSGMYARLGFAIAAHVKADVILTDEILAVGDAAFQRQCFKKFQELQASTSIVFVSHDLPAIKKICTRTIWLKDGSLQQSGLPEEVIDAYLESVQQEREASIDVVGQRQAETGGRRWGSGEIEIVKVATCDGQGRERNVFRTFGELLVRIHYRVTGPYRDPGFGVNIYSADGVFIHGTNTFIRGVPVKLDSDVGTVEVCYPKLPLSGGVYWLTVGVTAGNDWSRPYDLHERAQRFEVLTVQPDGGLVCFDHKWGDNV